MFHLVEMSSCGEDERHGQGVQSGMLPRGKNRHTSRSYRSKDQPRCQQYGENEHKNPDSYNEFTNGNLLSPSSSGKSTGNRTPKILFLARRNWFHNFVAGSKEVRI